MKKVQPKKTLELFVSEYINHVDKYMTDKRYLN